MRIGLIDNVLLLILLIWRLLLLTSTFRLIRAQMTVNRRFAPQILAGCA